MKHSIIKFIVPKIYHIKLRSFNWTSWKLSDALSINWQPAETTKRGEDGHDALYLGWLKGVTVVSVSNPVKIPTRKTRFMSWMMSSLDFKLPNSGKLCTRKRKRKKKKRKRKLQLGKKYLLLMFPVYGRQQHYFALFVAYSTEFLKLVLSHLNSLFCPAMQ